MLYIVYLNIAKNGKINHGYRSGIPNPDQSKNLSEWYCDTRRLSVCLSVSLSI